MREPGLGWTGLIVANSPGGDGVEEFEEGHMAGQWGVVQNYDEKSVCPNNTSGRAVSGWVFLVVWAETLEYLMVLTRIPPQSSPVLVIELAVAFY